MPTSFVCRVSESTWYDINTD